MSNIITTGGRTLKPEDWKFEARDGLWYITVPFECDENEDVVMTFLDSNDYVQEHKKDFDALNNGFTRKNECIITSDIKPSCDMLVEIQKAKLMKGEIIYHKDPETGEFLPEWKPEESGFGGFPFGMLGGMGLPTDIEDMAKSAIDAEVNKKEESKIII